MKINLNKIERSRLIAVAQSLTNEAGDSHLFTKKSVLLTGDEATLATPNGRDCLLSSFRLLIRMVENLTVRVPAGPLFDVVSQEAARISYITSPRIEVLGSDPIGFDAVLCVGTRGRTDVPWTVINSNGWLVRISSRGKDIASTCSQSNPIAALAAACFGVADVFKRLIALRPEKGELTLGMSFSLYTYRESDDPGPQLPREILLDAALFGAGAIGNGIICLLSLLPVVGDLIIVDRQVFQEENWGTCLIIGPNDFGLPKAKWAASVLPAGLNVGWLRGSVEDYTAKCGSEFSIPRLILNGFDNIPARRAVQGLWPDQIIDGAIGPTLCEVTLHPWGPDLSCLRCDFEEPIVDASELQVRSTGLRPERIADPTALVSEADISNAPDERKEWLRSNQGKLICSVVSEAVLANLSANQQDEGFEPSAPFVACLSACMVVTEMVRHCAGWPPVLETGYQFDSLVGPQNGIFKAHARKVDCECVSRRKNIELVRARRKNTGGFSVQE